MPWFYVPYFQSITRLIKISVLARSQMWNVQNKCFQMQWDFDIFYNAAWLVVKIRNWTASARIVTALLFQEKICESDLFAYWSSWVQKLTDEIFKHLPFLHFWKETYYFSFTWNSQCLSIMITMQWSFYALGMILKWFLFWERKIKKRKEKVQRKCQDQYSIFGLWSL